MSTKKFNAKTIEGSLSCSWLQLKHFNFGGKDKYWAFIYDRVFPDYYNIERVYLDKLSDRGFSWWINKGLDFIRECEQDISNLDQMDELGDSIPFDETPTVTSDQGLVSSGLVNYTVTIDRIGELSISELNIPTLDNTEAHNLRVSPGVSVTEYDISSRVSSTQNIEHIEFNVPDGLWEDETTPETREIIHTIDGQWLELANYVPTTETSLPQEAINTVNQTINDDIHSSLRDRLRGFSSTLTDDEIRTLAQGIF